MIFFFTLNSHKEGWLLLKLSGKYHIFSKTKHLKHIFCLQGQICQLIDSLSLLAENRKKNTVCDIFHVASTNLWEQRIPIL